MITKEDYIKAIEKMDDNIATIDPAIPQNLIKGLISLGLDSHLYAYVYYKTGGASLVNIIEKYTILKESKWII